MTGYVARMEAGEICAELRPEILGDLGADEKIRNIKVDNTEICLKASRVCCCI